MKLNKNITKTLQKLTHKNAVFKGGQAEQDSFDQLKKCLANLKTLGYYDKNAETQVIADASPVGLGAVLTPKQGEDYRVICYASRSLTDTEKKVFADRKGSAKSGLDLQEISCLDLWFRIRAFDIINHWRRYSLQGQGQNPVHGLSVGFYVYSCINSKSGT